MDIFESLESLNVSEECFDDIMGIVEELLNEDDLDYKYKKLVKKDDNSKRKNDLLNYYDYHKGIEYKYHSPGSEDKSNIQPTLNQKIKVQAEKKGLDGVKTRELRDKATEIQNKHDENSSSEERERAEKSREELRKPLEYSRVHYWSGSSRHPETLPDYQHAKKIARKALRGHTVDGTATPEKEERIARSSEGNGKARVHNTPDFLYRIGKKIIKHRKKNEQQMGESLLEELMILAEDLRTLHRQYAPKLYDLKKKREAKLEELKRKKREEERARYRYEDDDDDDYNPDYDDDRDYMDAVFKKAPGVSYTSAEWHDN